MIACVVCGIENAASIFYKGKDGKVTYRCRAGCMFELDHEVPDVKVRAWEAAAEHSRIRRINYKAVLGVPLMTFLRDNRHVSDDEVYSHIWSLLMKPENWQHLSGLSNAEVEKNLRISISARKTEREIYGKS